MSRAKSLRAPRGPRAKAEEKPSALKPSAALLCKLGRLARHADQFFSMRGHVGDRAELMAALGDAEVRAWLDEMGALKLVPAKR